MDRKNLICVRIDICLYVKAPPTRRPPTVTVNLVAVVVLRGAKEEVRRIPRYTDIMNSRLPRLAIVIPLFQKRKREKKRGNGDKKTRTARAPPVIDGRIQEKRSGREALRRAVDWPGIDLISRAATLLI
ncbi:hypothetical protein EYF80_029725 [Liparis tanakae]|uniref:Uncharacterized protein n=1 Tax=Liparis tanakae TaxID=230148 RepID=A0A4Z2H2N8_9TELE|nr:hypothetical protein EYF80_029725 [Liparis tanakae]